MGKLVLLVASSILANTQNTPAASVQSFTHNTNCFWASATRILLLQCKIIFIFVLLSCYYWYINH